MDILFVCTDGCIVHVCMYVLLCVQEVKYMDKWMKTGLCVYVHMYVCMDGWMGILCVCMYGYYVDVYVWMWTIRTYKYTHIPSYIHTNKHTGDVSCGLGNADVYIHTCIHTHIHTHIQAISAADLGMQMYTCIHTYIHTYIQAISAVDLGMRMNFELIIETNRIRMFYMYVCMHACVYIHGWIANS